MERERDYWKVETEGETAKVKFRDKRITALIRRAEAAEAERDRLAKALDEAKMEITDKMVETAARAASVRYPEGDGSEPGQAWYWSERYDHPANKFAHESRDEDRAIARAVLTATLAKMEAGE